MKTQLIKASFILLSLVFGLTTSSCSSDDDGGSGGNAANGTVTAKVDGANLQSNEMFSQATIVNQGGASVLQMQGTDNSGKGFNFVVNGYEGEGTYDIGGDNLIFVIASYIETDVANPTNSQTWSAPYDGDAIRGSISFNTATDDKVQGTFEFTAKNDNDGSVKDITEGSFNLDISSF